jgi:hypothetical protein
VRADTSLSPEDRRTKMQAIRADITAQMKAILTDDQFAKYQKMTQRNHRPAPPAGGDNAGGTPPPAAPPQN